MENFNLNKIKNPYSFWQFKNRIKYQRNIKKWKRQRIERGFADYDIWAMYDFLLSILPEMLHELADIHHGAPHGRTKVEWSWLLDEMALHFELANEDSYYDTAGNYIDPTSGRVTLRKEEMRRALEKKEIDEEFAKKFHTVMKKNNHSMRWNLDAGLEMLGKEFWDLWD